MKLEMFLPEKAEEGKAPVVIDAQVASSWKILVTEEKGE